MAKYGLNKVVLIGNLGRDPELKYTDQGIAWTNLWMACTESYRDKNGNNVDKTEWISVNLWRAQAEIAAKYCKRGSTICIEGKISSRTYTTEQGENRRITEVEGRKLVLLDSRPPAPGTGSTSAPVSQVPEVGQTHVAENPAQSTPTDDNAVSSTQDDLDDLPF